MKKNYAAKIMKSLLVSGAATAMLFGMSTTAMADDVTISIFNSKSEIQSQLEEMAESYYEKTGVKVEVYYSSDTVAAHMSTRYASNEPYTISMVDPKDIYVLGPEHAVDLSDEEWVNDTTQAISIDDQVYGFPVCVEARGIIYNKTAIENITGETFDPADYVSRNAFEELIQELIDGGMETPTAIIKEDWSLAAHYFAGVYETQDNVDAFIEQLQAGEADLAENDRYNDLLDTFDVLKANNYAADNAVAVVLEDNEMYLADGDIAFMYGGTWDWEIIEEFSPDEMGLMAVPQDNEEYQGKLVGGASKYFFIDNSEQTSEEQVQAAKDFLNWLVYDEEGQDFLVNSCEVVPAFNNIELEPASPLASDTVSYLEAGMTVDTYNLLPDDHYSKVGASLQKYLADEIDRDELAAEIEEYWSSVETDNN